MDYENPFLNLIEQDAGTSAEEMHQFPEFYKCSNS
jgi:hypothetical protein